MTTLTTHYTTGWVVVSILISMATAYAGLVLADRKRAAVKLLTHRLWLVCGSVSMGIGIWSMHYLGMLAVQISVPVYYHWPTVLLSLGMAIVASFAALKTISGNKLGPRRLFCGGLLMAAGIGGMHYTGMAAMRSTAMENYNYWIVALSILAAGAFSWLALWIAFAVRDSEKRGAGILRVAGGCVMGLGIASMHYIAMAGATFSLCAVPFSMAHTVKVGLLGQVGVATAAILTLLAALATSALDKRRFHDLREAHAKLEDAQQALLHANELLSALSNLDGLTGLSNRRHFDMMLDTEWSRAGRTRKPLSALMIDIDSFKALNDRYGHQRGDECLRRVAEALLNPAHRVYDLAARYGGEEFVLLLPETEMADAVRIAESICQAVRGLKLENLGAIGNVVTVSIGVATRMPDPGDNVASLVEAADCALYAAKRSGKNHVEASCPSFNSLNPLQAEVCNRCRAER